jgi:hypothetical protein
MTVHLVLYGLPTKTSTRPKTQERSVHKEVNTADSAFLIHAVGFTEITLQLRTVKQSIFRRIYSQGKSGIVQMFEPH